MQRILVTYPADEVAVRYGAALEALRGLGEVVVNPQARTMTPDEIVASARGCVAIVADRNTPFDALGYKFVALLRAALCGTVTICSEALHCTK